MAQFGARFNEHKVMLPRFIFSLLSSDLPLFAQVGFVAN
jgi:hypothetical protein